jgi:hypothetical protein
MADLICPGYNRDVASGTAWDFASEPDPNDTQTNAQSKADAKAMVNAMAQFPLHQCPPPCISIPIVRFGKRGAPTLPTPAEADFKLALAYTEWFLDVLCIPPPGVPVPPHEDHRFDVVEKYLAAIAREPVKEGDIIDYRWKVKRLCKTDAPETVTSGEIKILTVRCAGGCQDGTLCQVLSRSRGDILLGQPKWTLVPHSEGGVVIRRLANQAFDEYQCACLEELP